MAFHSWWAPGATPENIYPPGSLGWAAGITRLQSSVQGVGQLDMEFIHGGNDSISDT